MRNKAKGVEMLSVMLLLILFAFVVFLVIDAGTSAFGSITQDKLTTMSARVAYSYIGMKVKQNDTGGRVSIEQTKYGDTLRIDSERFSTHIFYFEGGLYECLTKPQTEPDIAAANRITKLDGFSVLMEGSALCIECIYQNEDDSEIIKGTIGLRSRV